MKLSTEENIVQSDNSFESIGKDRGVSRHPQQGRGRVQRCHILNFWYPYRKIQKQGREALHFPLGASLSGWTSTHMLRDAHPPQEICVSNVRNM